VNSKWTKTYLIPIGIRKIGRRLPQISENQPVTATAAQPDAANERAGIRQLSAQ